MAAAPPLHERFPNVSRIEMNYDPADPAAYVLLLPVFLRADARHMAHLTHVSLSVCTLAAPVLAALAECASLQSLALPNVQRLPGAALRPLAKLPRMQELALGDVACDADAFAALCSLTALTALRWDPGPLPSIVTVVGAWPEGCVLRSLRVGGPACTLDFSALSCLTALTLDGRVVDNAIMTRVARLPTLLTLTCGSFQVDRPVSDDPTGGIPPLALLSSLETTHAAFGTPHALKFFPSLQRIRLSPVSHFLQSLSVAAPLLREIEIVRGTWQLDDLASLYRLSELQELSFGSTNFPLEDKDLLSIFEMQPSVLCNLRRLTVSAAYQYTDLALSFLGGCLPQLTELCFATSVSPMQFTAAGLCAVAISAPRLRRVELCGPCGITATQLATCKRATMACGKRVEFVVDGLRAAPAAPAPGHYMPEPFAIGQSDDEFDEEDYDSGNGYDDDYDSDY